MLQADPTNCGVKHLYNLGGLNLPSSHEYILMIMKEVQSLPMGLCCFNDNVDGHDKSNGRILAKFIQDNNLGMIVAGPVAPNPIHKNETHIQSWSWAVDKVALWKYLAEHKTQAQKDLEAKQEKLKKEAEAKAAAKNAEYAKQVLEEFRPKPENLAKPLTPAQAARKLEWNYDDSKQWMPKR